LLQELKPIREAFNNLMGNWYQDEQNHYAETYCEDEGEDLEPEEIDTDALQSHNYRDLRVLDDFFKSLVNFLYCFVFVL
jgi:hypothetical protein